MFFQQMSGKIGLLQLSISFHVPFIFSGLNAVIFYTVQIFKSAGTAINPNISSIIVGLVLLISNTVATFLIDKIGRRILLIVSDSGMALGLFGLGLFFYLKDLNSINLGETIDYCNSHNATGYENEINSVPESLGLLPLASLMLFVASFNFGFGPIPLLYIGELLPSHVKG
jgi:facilitated trehalose transporter